MRHTRLKPRAFGGFIPPWAWAAGVIALMPVALLASPVPVERLLVLLCVAPLVEEAVFRVGLQQVLMHRLRSPAFANVLTAAVFGAAHALARHEAAAFMVALPALFVGALFQRTGQLRWCVLAHASLNGLWFAAGLAWPSLLPFA